MKINFELDAKLIAGVAIGAAIVCGALFIQPTKAQTASSLSGQYGCILNKNFAGYNLADVKSTNDGSITGTNQMMYMDFTKNGFQINVIGLKTWGVANIVPGSATVTNGTLSVVPGPLTNSFSVTTSVTNAGTTWTMTYYLMPVISGSTLLLQSGITANGDGEPSTGVCSRI
jgi:hypothetical protein